MCTNGLFLSPRGSVLWLRRNKCQELSRVLLVLALTVGLFPKRLYPRAQFGTDRDTPHRVGQFPVIELGDFVFRFRNGYVRFLKGPVFLLEIKSQFFHLLANCIIEMRPKFCFYKIFRGADCALNGKFGRRTSL